MTLISKKSKNPLARPCVPQHLPPEYLLQTRSRYQRTKKEAGVGLLFNREEDKGWVVKTFIKGSPAQISGEIQGGDVLVSVNSKAIHDVSSLGALSKELMGTEGDSVELVFARGEIQHTVSLVRSNSFLGADGGKMMKQAVRKFGTWEATRKDFRPASTDEAVEEPGSVDL